MKNILITGAGRGLGLALTKLAVSQKNMRVIAVSRSQGNLGEVETDLGSELKFMQVDLSQEQEVQGLVKQIKNLARPLDGMILNAGIFEKTNIESSTWADLDRMMKVNCYAAFSICAGFFQFMSEGAHIVLVSSMGGFQGSSKFAGNTGYSVSKGALSILGECLAAEFQHKRVSVNVVCPGAIRTEMLKSAFPDYAGGVETRQMAEWVWNYFMLGGGLFNGAILPVSTGSV